MDIGFNPAKETRNQPAALADRLANANAAGQFVRVIADAKAANAPADGQPPSAGQTDDPALAHFGSSDGLADAKNASVKKRSGPAGNSPEYDKLFADGKLQSTIAIGHDKNNLHQWQIRELHQGLKSHGYTATNPRKATADQLRAAGIDPRTVDRDALYYTKTFQYDGRPVKSVVKLITPDSPNAKDRFAKAMAESELVMYAGHSRYGSGPDFDGSGSPKGNFVIGKPYEDRGEGHLVLNEGRTDLQKTAMTKSYQLMMFNACKSDHYVDDLRAVAGKDSGNLDLVVTTGKPSAAFMADNLLIMLTGVTGAKSIDEIRTSLALSEEKDASFWAASGFEDN